MSETWAHDRSSGPNRAVNVGPAATYGTGPGFRGYKFDPALTSHRFEVFLSSPNDCRPARQMVRALLNDAYNPVLATYSNAYLAPIMWEDALTQRVEGQTSNDIFVEKAITCHATLVLFKTRLGRGTREEVEALLAVPREQRKVLSVVRFALADDEEHAEDASAVTEFLHEIGEREKVYYRPTGPMGSPEASTELTKILNGYMLAAISRSQEQERVDAP